MLKRSEQTPFSSLFSPSTAGQFIVFCIMTLALSRLPEIPTEVIDKKILNVISLVLIILVFVAWRIYEHSRQRKLAALLSFEINKDTKPPNAKGLIVMLSPYDPRLRQDEASYPLDIERVHSSIERVRREDTSKLTQADFDAINIEQSNLRPQIEAVKYHKQTLKDVWMIVSKDSKDTRDIFMKYVQLNYNNSIQLHTHIGKDELCTDSWNYRRIWEFGEKIFRESGYSGYGIIADITGGTKMMSVALAMACIPPGRRMQYIYSGRDEFGNPLARGAIDPVLVDVDPILYAPET